MKHSLGSLLKKTKHETIVGNKDRYVDRLEYDSRAVTPGCLFVCIHGQSFDAHRYIPDVVENGASVIVVSNDQDVYGTEELKRISNQSGVTFVSVEDTRIALAQMSAAFFDYPADKLEMIGITGTKGKTTTTYMVHDIFTRAGRKTGMIGTVANVSADEIKPASRTTPEAVDLQRILSEMVEKGLDSCVMEVSSLGLQFDRVHGCVFSVGAFTNLYPDHISQTEHSDMTEYLNAKLHLFEQSKNAVINMDCPVGPEVADHAKKYCPVFSYGLAEDCDCRAEAIKRVRRSGMTGTEFSVISPWYRGNVFVALPGRFNVYNALCAIAISGLSCIPFAAVKEALEKVSVPGRLQMISNKRNITVLVDYAHNSASLEILLGTLREYCHGRLITVFGCGGNRSKSRRTEMGAVSGRISDLTIVTSDNPRKEEPMDIIRDILDGLEPTGGTYIVEPDRTTAIKLAILEANVDDFVVIAGKGHEDY
ncbi:MAG: UDP-N-acetylmuramoyl-L-alanyl-D-glutamate--2,6-diaminopimelate ligase, partial [Clostridiales bacterium]|nr:UDP-N-acetylmuramoyl-L-alanyl-D-glutamate--2,6-diaminopimelate ligase [Clostridiales bacterium]